MLVWSGGWSTSWAAQGRGQTCLGASCAGVTKGEKRGAQSPCGREGMILLGKVWERRGGTRKMGIHIEIP